LNNRFTYINNSFVTESQAAIGINDLALLRGYGIFDFFKVVNNQPLFLADHLDRFYASAGYMRLAVGITKDALKDIIQQLLLKNNLPYSGVRLTLTGGYSEDGYQLATPNLIITQQPLQPPAATHFERGLRLISYPHQRQLAHVKSIDYLVAVWLQPLLQQKEADDVLYHKQEVITECPRSNIFMVTQDEVLVTPAENMLKGITRMKVLALVQKHLKVEERAITLTELKQAKEAFITSTTKQIIPVVQIDDARIGTGLPGAITRKLKEDFTGLLEEIRSCK
jgi:branched-chain amino acid aminotransferase